jgi:hypothetical protein
MGLLYELVVETADATTTVQIEANSKEEALETAQELYPGCRLGLVKPEPGDSSEGKRPGNQKPPSSARGSLANHVE